jgi:hypothetical protein
MVSTLPANASTVVYTDKAGVKYAYYHVTPTGVTSWEHPYTGEARKACPVCTAKGARR